MLPSFGFGWAFNVGGTDQDAGTGITPDGSGNLYVTGWFLSSTVNFDPNHTNPNNPNNTLTNPNPGTVDLQFIAKYTSSKTFEWVTLLGRGNEASGDIALDSAGHAYVGYVDESNNTSHVAQLNASSGSIIWNDSFLGNTASTSGFYAGVAISPSSGDVYIAGTNASSQAFVAKLDGSGNVLWDQSPSVASSEALAVTVDSSSSENVYLAYVNSSNVFVGKLDSASGSTIWAGSVGSNGNTGADIAVDRAGNVYVTGGGTYNPLSRFSNSGFFVAKLVPGANGSLTQSWNEKITWNHKISGDAWSSGLAVDLAGNVYTTGGFRGSVNFNLSGGSYVLTSASKWYDVCTSELDTNGNFVAAADIVKGNGNNYGHAIAVDSSGSVNVYTTGGFRGTANFNPTGTYNLTVDGGSSSPCQDVFVSQLIQPSGGGAAALSASDSVRESAVLLASSPMTLAHFGASSNALQAASGAGTSQRTVLNRAFVLAAASARSESDAGSTAPSRPERQPTLLDLLFADLQDGALQDILLGEIAVA
jgi:hypothetical protein